MDLGGFLLEEYKSNWDYLKHIEEIRLKLYQLHIAITAAMLSVIAALYKFSNGNTGFIDQSTLYISGFLSVYGFLFIWLMFNQKRSYEKYRDMNAELRDLFYSDLDDKLPESFKNALESIKPKGARLGSTFISWVSLPLSISIASTVIFFRGLCA